MPRDLEYEKNNVGYDIQFPKEEGGGIKCKNYELCDAIAKDIIYVLIVIYYSELGVTVKMHILEKVF